MTVGGWANVDLGRYDDADDFSQSGGVSGFNLSEFDPWAEVSVPVGKATLTGGVVGYVFPNDFGVTDDFNTWEVYGKVGLGVPLSPKLAVYYDFDKVKGAYLEGTVAHAVPLGSVSLNLGALGGPQRRPGRGRPIRKRSTTSSRTASPISTSRPGVPFSAGIFSITPVRPLPGERRRGDQVHLARRRERREAVGRADDQLVARVRRAAPRPNRRAVHGGRSLDRRAAAGTLALRRRSSRRPTCSCSQGDLMKAANLLRATALGMLLARPARRGSGADRNRCPAGSLQLLRAGAG